MLRRIFVSEWKNVKELHDEKFHSFNSALYVVRVRMREAEEVPCVGETRNAGKERIRE
jgi:hypothetical protein